MVEYDSSTVGCRYLYNDAFGDEILNWFEIEPKIVGFRHRDPSEENSKTDHFESRHIC